MKKRGTKHNGVTLDEKGQPQSKYARKQKTKLAPIDAMAREHYARELNRRFGRVVINGQYLGNARDD